MIVNCPPHRSGQPRLPAKEVGGTVSLVQQAPLGFLRVELPGTCSILAFTYFTHSVIHLSIEDSYTCQAEWVRDTCERE